jgi:hypothetical protein
VQGSRVTTGTGLTFICLCYICRPQCVLTASAFAHDLPLFSAQTLILNLFVKVWYYWTKLDNALYWVCALQDFGRRWSIFVRLISHGCDYDGYCLVGYDAVYFGVIHWGL